MAHTFLRQWVRFLFTRVRPRGQGRPAIRPALELLETRVTPSVTFGGQTTIALGDFPLSVATGDFNGDGRPDVVAGVDNGSAVAVMLNTTVAGATATSFALPVGFTVGSYPASVAVGDFNGDGKPDIVVANEDSNTISVLLNQTPAGATVPVFAAQVTFAVGGGPRSVAVGDFNGDGRPDIVVANGNDNTVSVLLNTTAAGATVPSFTQKTFAAGSEPASVAVGDFNGDGRPDIVVTDVNLFPNNEVGVLLNTTAAGATAPSFAAEQTFTVGVDAFSVAVGDFNGDGKPDLTVANYNNNEAGTISVFLNTAAAGATAASFAPQATFAAGVGPESLAVGDFNGDGRPDLIVANGGDNTVSVLVDTAAAGATAPTFATQATFAVDSGAAVLAAADFNGDGKPDFAAVNFGSPGAMTVRLNTTTPFAMTTPVVVANVHGMGVVEYNRTTGQWVRLNPGNPADVTLLAADPQGDVFADYRGYGVFRYTPSVGSWRMVNGTDAVAIAVDGAGDLFASFNGAGVGEFRLDGSSRLLTPVAATLLSADAGGDLAGDFAGYGVFRYAAFSGQWTNVNGADAEALGIDAAGDVFASFAGAGVGEFRVDGTARLLTPVAASLLAADAAGDLAADFPGYGVYRYRAFGAAFTPLNGADAEALAIDAACDVFASFAGAGVGEFPLSGSGSQVGASAASLLAADPFASL